ncbi:MAG: KdsC family phosphatase [Planctomycetota bacterium]|jgi:YrbI family 3-deoxy-D-manno-octulosonate 8-phosphate phosphatase
MNRRKNKQLPIISREDVDLIVYDFDGVMTDNRVLVMQNGTEAVYANRADGLGVELIRAMGIPQLILSTETNSVVDARAQKLHIEAIIACKNKKNALESYCSQNGYDQRRILFVGNDVNDLEVMKTVGFPIAPADAHTQVLQKARFVTKARGGEGVVRELAEMLV